MNEQDKAKPAQIDGAEAQLSSADSEMPSRRELIERYGKYALVAAPLFMFVSKARAIHSRP